jgi:hypothetical protein
MPSLNKLFTTQTNSYNRIDIAPWLNGLNLYMRTYIPDLLNENKWIEIGSCIDLISYFPQAIQNNPALIPQEYLTFTRYITDTLTYLNKTNWKIEDINNIWQLTSIAEFPSAKCLLSTLYPDWNGKFITECFIPNSNFNHPSIMSNTVIDLNNSYPTLTSGQFVITTNIIENSYYISLIQITVYNGIKSFKEKQILVNDFFKSSITANGDVLINGSLDVRTFNNISVIQTDNVSKITTFHDKVGINQEPYEVKALLDIDNLSNENILTIVDKIADLNNTSYNVVEQVKDTILNNDTFNISPDYTNDIVVFKVPIKIKIEESDISFLHKPSNIFKINKFSSNSFLKIQIIINEINKMNVEIDNYNSTEGHTLIMSFVELLNDTEYYYVCSLKAIFKDSDIYFVMSFTQVQNIMVDNSYKKIFTNLINAFSSINRLLNYSTLVVDLPEIYNKLIEGDSVNSFTKYVQESEFRNRFELNNGEFVNCVQYFSDEKLDEDNWGKFLFSEQNTLWNLKDLKYLFLNETDKKIESLKNNAMKYYKDKYGFYKNSQNFISHYLYYKGERIIFLNKIIIKDIRYIIGTGINLSDYIDLNILSTGDNKITGNLYIQDENKTNIFSVDTEYNKITNMYKTGFGTEYPKTILDVNDSGLTEIINIIKDMANKEHALNLNIGFIKNLETINADSIDNCINTQFIYPNSTNSGYQQTKDDYFYCYNSPVNDNPNDYENTYIWLYRNWDNKKFINIDDKNNELIIKNSIDVISRGFKQEYIFDNARTIYTGDWTFGKKFRSRRLLNKDDKQYIFGNGTNIGNYNLKINNNGNISAFFDYIKYMNLYLQNFIIRLNNIATTSIPNYNSVNDHFSIISNVVSPKQFKLKKIVADFTDFTKTTVYDIDFYTQAVSGNDSNKTIYQIQDVNERSKYVLMLTNINSIYSKNNNKSQLFNKGDYGIINLEDKFVDYLSLFYCSDTTANSVTLISMELQINTVIQPSVDIGGDLRIKGDTYFHNGDTNTDFVCIDTNASFIGIGTNERYVNYNTSFLNTTQGNLGRHTFIVSGSTFPVAVIERYAEIIPTRDSNNAIINYPAAKLELFRSKSTLSVRRSSSYYDINELNYMSKKYTTTKIAGPYIGQIQKYNYGTDINFEIMDKSDITYNMGKIHVGIDDISNNRILAGFGFSVIDNTADNKTSDRNLMYINNNGIMNIDKITLGMDTTTTNNVLLSASNNDLLINNVTLTDIINNIINSMFSVNSTSGNLNITYKEITYECNKI